MEKILKSVNNQEKTVRVVVGCQEIREYSIFHEITYETSVHQINHLIKSIHLCLAETKSRKGIKEVVYYENCYGHNIEVINDSIINLISFDDIHLTLMPSGAIIIWGTHDIYSTVDMQQLCFHEELEDFLKKYSILDLSSETIVLKQNTSNKIEKRSIKTDLTLWGNCPVRIWISDKKKAR